MTCIKSSFQTPLEATLVMGIWIPSSKILLAAHGRDPGTLPPTSVIWPKFAAQATRFNVSHLPLEMPSADPTQFLIDMYRE